MLGVLARITKILLTGMPYEKPVFIIALRLGPNCLKKYVSLASYKSGFGEYIFEKRHNLVRNGQMRCASINIYI